MSSVIIVDPDLLPEAPLAFQQYVEEFFVKKKLLGREVLYAATVLSMNYSYGRVEKGVAPSHSVDLMRFKDGLKKDQSLNEWMSKADGKFLWRLYGATERHDCGACDDD